MNRFVQNIRILIIKIQTLLNMAFHDSNLPNIYKFKWILFSKENVKNKHNPTFNNYK